MIVRLYSYQPDGGGRGRWWDGLRGFLKRGLKRGGTKGKEDREYGCAFTIIWVSKIYEKDNDWIIGAFLALYPLKNLDLQQARSNRRPLRSILHSPLFQQSRTSPKHRPSLPPFPDMQAVILYIRIHIIISPIIHKIGPRSALTFPAVPLPSGAMGGLRRKFIAQQQQMIQSSYPAPNNNFSRLLFLLAQEDRYKEAIACANQQYIIKTYKISEFNPLKIAALYEVLTKKFYHRRARTNEECWYENQLRIYIWLLIGYLYIHRRTIQEMTQADWEFFSHIFNHRNYSFFQYQSISLLKHAQKSPKWTPEEAALLEQIIESKNYQKKWNSIARELYTRSLKRYYRNPKQCRQHWMNHLDPLKVHTGWTIQEDITLMTTVKEEGKKWSMVVKRLGNTRTEHMVKNRYKSLVSVEMKKRPEMDEAEIERYILSCLQGGTSEKNQSVNPQEQKMFQQIKAVRQQTKKRTNSSDSPLLESQSRPASPSQIQLSQSDFLNSPLPIPGWTFHQQQIKQQLIHFREQPQPYPQNC